MLAGTPEAIQAHEEHLAASQAEASATATPSEQYTTYSDHPSPAASPPVPPPPPQASSQASSTPPPPLASSSATVESATSAPLPPLDALDVNVAEAGRNHSSGGETAPADGLQGGAIEAELAKMEARTDSF